MTVQIIRGNALQLPLADDSVDLVVTSPPYFGLRSYTDAGQHYDGQIGSEPTPAEFLDALIAATAEMVRVVKPSGSIWVNLGDKYGRSQTTNVPQTKYGRKGPQVQPEAVPSYGTPKSLMGLPWRYAIRCIDDLGLILRAEVIWAKPNGLPESVTDRVRRSHEQWFHFTLQPRYYSAVDEIREPHNGNAHASGNGASRQWRTSNEGANHRALDTDPSEYNPLGKLPGSVWSIPSQPLTVPAELGVDHFAAFPMEWPRRIITGWSPRGICTACGQGRRPTTERKPMEWRPGPSAAGYNAPGATVRAASGTMLSAAETTITGEACGCEAPTVAVEIEERDMATGARVRRIVQQPDPSWINPAPTRPGTVLDPFGGTGTTALVAHALGRHGITVDMSADYCRLAEWRCNDPGQLAAAMQVEKPAPVPDGQLSLLEGIA